MFLNRIKILEKIAFVALALAFVFIPTQNLGAQSDTLNFFVESNFDVSGRSKIEAVLVKTSENLYLYVEKSWWELQSQAKKGEVLKNLDGLSVEFQNNIYPKLTSNFGFERTPGIDKNTKITVLFHPVKGAEDGYFRTADGYEKLQISTSNEREMLYISTDLLHRPQLKVALAHEFVHLITFNQKDINFRVEEDVWLNEARAEYASTILGYDGQSDLSNLQSRIRDFFESSSDSVTEWRGLKYDYASASLFIHYLAEHYGVKILSDSLKSKYVGIESINYALEKNGYKERFSEIFTNWTIALALNDCSLGKKYCYVDKNFNGIRIAPNINFLPTSGNASLSVINTAKNWAGNWQKFIGGNGDLKLEFSVYSDIKFALPYITEDKDGKYAIKVLIIEGGKNGVIDIADFGSNYKSLTIIPSLQEKESGFEGTDTAQPFNYSVSVGSSPDANQLLMQQLLEQIESLKRQIAQIQGKLGANSGQNCVTIGANLSFGMTNNNQVKCLQSFLRAQGGNIYPEGLVTGNFGNLTRLAVMRFQQKYASEILAPLGLTQATGYVGASTREKINKMMAN